MNIELSLVAVMLKTGDFGPIVREEITEDHFETDQGKILFNFITTYRDESDGVARYPSLSIVRSRFGETLELPEPDLGDNVQNLTHEVRAAKVRSELRQFSVAAEDIANGPDDPVGMMMPWLGKLRRSAEGTQRTNHISLATAFPGIIDDYENGNILPDGIPWPWKTMNAATKGMHKKEFIVIAGRPKSRKTFTALRVVMNAFRESNQRVLIFSPEMPPRQMFLRCIAHLANLPYREFKDGSLHPADEMRLYEAAGTYGRIKEMDDETYAYQLIDKLPSLSDIHPSLDIVQSTGKDTAWMAAQIELFEPTIFLADSFYRQRAPGQKKNDVDYKAVSALSREIKDLTMNCNVAGIGTHQMNRGAEKGIGDLGNLALADAIGADADGVYRVVTGKINGEDVSALFNLGGREAAYDGVLIKNKPCYDYEEVGPIENRKQVTDLMKQEETEAAKEERAQVREAVTHTAGNMPRGPRRTATASGRSATSGAPRKALNVTKSRFVSELEEAAFEELEELAT